MADRESRRAGPRAVFEPTDEDRAAVEKLQADSRAQREAEQAEAADAAEAAGVPPSDEQRAAVLQTERKSAEQRAGAARALRRGVQPIAEPEDADRDLVADLQAEAREQLERTMADRGQVEPAILAETAGFAPELEALPGDALYGVFKCSTCGGNIERSFPGFPDPDAASRELVCPQCGARQSGGEAPRKKRARSKAEPSASK